MQIVLQQQTNDGFREYEFVYATHKVIDTNVYPAKVRKVSDNTVQDIGYSGTVINASQITTFADGSETRFLGLYDQTERLPMISKSTPSYQPLATDLSFNGLDYAKISTQSEGFTNVIDLNIDFSKDVVVHYVFRNEGVFSSQRMNLAFSTSKSGGGLFVLGMRPGTNYTVGFTINNDLTYLSQGSQRRAVIASGNLTTDFNLFTFSKIGGVYKFHRNGLEQTLDTTNEIIGNPLGHVDEFKRYGITIGTGYSTSLEDINGRINDFKGVLFKGGDLSAFDLSAEMTTVMSKFNIT